MQVQHIRYPIIPDPMIQINPSAVAIGSFDGIHVGHRTVFNRTKEMAKQQNILAGAMTFHPHPREVLRPGTSFECLTPLPEKLRQMEREGMDIAYVVHFDRELAALPPHRFIDEVLIPLGIKGVVVGFNYTFGHKARGKAEDLKRLSEGRFTVEIVQPIHADGLEVVSSTRIRTLLEQGDVQDAAKLLGRPYYIDGIVKRGAGRGKHLGFPTANIHLVEPYVIPQTGVYAVKVERQGRTYDGAMSIGYNPTFEQDRKTKSVEVYLIDFSEELYGERLSVYFLQYLRPEEKFDTVDELIQQMDRDVQRARKILSDLPLS